MFEMNKPKYLTRGVNAEIPIELQLFMWNCIDSIPKKKDYLQVFKLSNENGMQRIEHSHEQPNFKMNYVLTTIDNPVTEKIYVIDDGEHLTMLLAKEY